MILEIIATLLVGIILGVILVWAIDKKSNIAAKMKDKLHKRDLSKVTRNPELLKKKLEANGEIVDDGEKISFEIVNGKIVAKREKIKAPTPKLPGIPAKSIKKVVKKAPTKKKPKKPVINAGRS